LDLAEKLEFVRNAAPQEGPCHTLKVQPFQSYPAWVVSRDPWGYNLAGPLGGRLESTCPNGKCAPEIYAQREFLDILNQAYSRRGKVYFRPAFYTENGINQEFVGWLSYRVTKLKEKYDSKKHGSWGYREVNQRGVSAKYNYDGATSPVRYNYSEMTRVGSNNTLTGPILRRVKKDFMIYEYCSNVTWHYAAGTVEHPEFRDAVGTISYNYPATSTPTYLGYRAFANKDQTDALERLALAETGVLFLRDITPLLGTGVRIYDCAQGGDITCWAEAGISAVGDAFLGLSFLSASTKAANATKVLGYASIGGNYTMSGIYTARGEYLNAIASVVSGTVDVGVLRIGSEGITAGKLGTAIPPQECPKVPAIVKASKTRTAFECCPVVDPLLKLPSNLDQGKARLKELLDELARGESTLDKILPLAASDRHIREAMAEIGAQTIIRRGENFRSGSPAHCIPHKNIVEFNPKAKNSAYDKEVIVAHEISDLQFTARVAPGYNKPELPLYTTEFSTFLDDVKRQNASVLNSILENKIRMTHPNYPSGLPITQVYELEDTAWRHIRDLMFDYYRETRSFRKQTEFYFRHRVCNPDIRTPAMEDWAVLSPDELRNTLSGLVRSRYLSDPLGDSTQPERFLTPADAQRLEQILLNNPLPEAMGR
jgi:hypothetical protein